MNLRFSSLFLIAAATLAGCKKETPIEVEPSFTCTVINGGNGVLPADVQVKNTSTGANHFHWTFEGGEPAASSEREPGTIRFTTAGRHKIVLEAWNEDGRKSQETLLQLDSVVTVDFEATVVDNAFAPATVRLTNRTKGASSYVWTFDGGSPASSDLQTPPDVVFSSPGEHSISLRAGDGTTFFTLTRKITVLPPLAAAFTIVPSFDDDDYEAPVTATLNNTTASGTTWQWSATGGVIDSPATRQPTIHFSSPGSYTVTLVAGNGKQQQTVTQTILVKPNTNLRTLPGVKFGINTAQGSVGILYSAKLRRAFRSGEVSDASTGSLIDIAFYGLSASFSYNKFVSPDSLTAYGLPALPGAGHTLFINSQELCGCGAGMSAAEFDALSTDAPLQSLAIAPTAGGAHQFSAAMPDRVVLFRTADGRKGAIRIRQYVAAGADSYLLADIKIQKNQ